MSLSNIEAWILYDKLLLSELAYIKSDQLEVGGSVYERTYGKVLKFSGHLLTLL